MSNDASLGPSSSRTPYKTTDERTRSTTTVSVTAKTILNPLASSQEQKMGSTAAWRTSTDCRQSWAGLGPPNKTLHGPPTSPIAYGGIDFHIATRELSLLTKKAQNTLPRSKSGKRKPMAPTRSMKLNPFMGSLNTRRSYTNTANGGSKDYWTSSGLPAKLPRQPTASDTKAPGLSPTWRGGSKSFNATGIDPPSTPLHHWMSIASAMDLPDSAPDSASMGKRGAFLFRPPS
ncbi:hypothetical protein CF335_g7089 [Tilletia laevis]|nr:hypothetical protein CF335_g7089 [Tilletia laevis]